MKIVKGGANTHSLVHRIIQIRKLVRFYTNASPVNNTQAAILVTCYSGKDAEEGL